MLKQRDQTYKDTPNGTPIHRYSIYGRDYSYEYPQTSSAVEINKTLLSSVVPSYVKKMSISQTDWVPPFNLGIARPLPWWRRPRKGKRPTPGQSSPPLEFRPEDYLRYYSSTFAPTSISTTGSSGYSDISTSLIGKTINSFKEALAERTIVY